MPVIRPIRTSILACMALGSSLVAALAETLPYPLSDPPACANNLGEPVRFESILRHRSAENTGEVEPDEGRNAAAVARRDPSGMPTVIRFNFRNAPPELQAFIDRHECAHHQTGDIDRPHPPRNSPDHLMNESIADCIAILRLRDEEGYGQSGFDSVAAALRADMQAIGFPEISIGSRIANIRTCFAEYGPPGDFIDGVLERRRAQ
jgi:hypothetical protein